MKLLHQFEAVPLWHWLDEQQFSVQVVRLALLVLVLSATWFRSSRSELERAATQASSTDFKDRLRDFILATRNQSVAAAERTQEAAVGALRSNLCGLELQAVSADLITATNPISCLALLECDDLSHAVPDDEPEAQEP